MVVGLIANYPPIPEISEKFSSLAQKVLITQTARTEHTISVDHAPAAITPLSAACRCASHLPSYPSVLPP